MQVEGTSSLLFLWNSVLQMLNCKLVHRELLLAGLGLLYLISPTYNKNMIPQLSIRKGMGTEGNFKERLSELNRREMVGAEN